MSPPEGSPATGSEPADREPDITVRMGLTSNPLAWVMPVIRVGLFLATLALLPWLGKESCCGGILALVTGMYLVLYIRETFLVDRSIFRFYPDHLEIERRQRTTPLEVLRHGYVEVGHLELVEMSTIRMAISPPGEPRYTATMRVSPRMGEDLMDTLVDQIQAAAPRHRFSWIEHGRLHFSSNLDYPDVFPGLTNPIGAVSVNAPWIAAGDSSFRMNLPEVCVPGDAPLFTVVDQRILLPSSLILGTSEVVKERELQIHLLDREEYRIDAATRLVYLDDEPLGRVVENPGEYRIEFNRAVPTIAAVLLVVLFIDNRNRLKVRQVRAR